LGHCGFSVMTVCLNLICFLLTVQSGPSSIRGVVLADNGKPVWGATVRASLHTLNKYAVGHTDVGGRFEIVGLQSGDWTLSWEAPGHYPKQDYFQSGFPKPYNVEVLAGASVNVRLDLIRSAVFTGSIIRPDGKPFAYGRAVLLGYANMHGVDYRD